MMLILGMSCCIVRMEKHETNSSSMMGLCFELTSYAFQLAPFICCCYRKHGGGLMGYFGAKKTEDVLAGHFFWPKMRRDVRFVARCTTFQNAKS
jgi:hypothetical protein